MSYKQLVQPDLSVVGNAGWCLWFAEEVFKTGHLYATAEDAWNATHLPHPGQQPPADVSTLAYWTYYDTSQSMEFGHIATTVPGKGIFSSPFDKSYGNQWFSSIQAVTNRINQIAGANSRYLGWSEDLAGVKIIKQGEETMNKSQLTLIHQLVMGSEPGPDYLKGLDGASIDTVLAQLAGDINRLQLTGKMNKDRLTRLHRLAMGSEPGPAYLDAFNEAFIDPSMKQLEDDPNRLNVKTNLVAKSLAPGVYEVK